jgi:hypothetical protein
MARKKVWKEVTTRSVGLYSYTQLEDMVTDFKNLSKQYPGARVVERCEDYSEYKVISIQVERDETDAEMQKREAQEERNKAHRLAQFQALQKEFGAKS